MRAPAIVCALAAAASAQPPTPQLPTEANDDLPHTRAKLAPLVAGKRDCIPNVPDSEASVALDSFDGKLVACLQVVTRRDISVFFDRVSYACWNLDPKTAKLERRDDLGRSWFACQDGSCLPGYMNRTVAYDGKTTLAFDDAKHVVTIAARDGKVVRTFAAPKELAGQELLAHELTLVGAIWFAHVDDANLVFDDRGKQLAKLAGADVQVLDATHVLVAAVAGKGTIFDVTARSTREVELPGDFAEHAVLHAGGLYAMVERAFVTLDPKTFRERSRVPLKTCR